MEKTKQGSDGDENDLTCDSLDLSWGMGVNIGNGGC